MNIGLSSASFYPNINTEDSITLMKKLGFDCGEVFLNSTSEYEEDFANIILEQSLENNFKINSVHGFSSSFEPYLFDKYKRRRDDSFFQFQKICKFTKIVGADCYTFHGMRNKKLNEISKEFVFDIYDKLLYISKEKGIKLCQENVFWCMSGNIDFLYMLKERYECSIYFTLDIKQAYRAGKIPEEYIEVMGNSIENLHINDRDGKNSCLIPGKGDVNFKKIFCKLKEIGYNKIGVIEVYRDNYKEYKELSAAGEYIKSCFTY